ncbi:hypothetical protein ACF3M2_19625 [Tissierella carlieri]|uniref:hypothetical protein n=1 Tax=Tissierella carlieri TaxID=689904 RepID=UPI0038656F8B
MKEYKVICIDMFQTLVNIESRVEYIWKRILEEDYNEELRDKYVQTVRIKIVDKFHVSESTSTKFKSLKEIFLRVLRTFLKKTK